jgi:hypothetical protein
VDFHSAGNAADGSRADTIFLSGPNGGLNELWPRTKPKVIVGGEVDNSVAVKDSLGELLAVQDSQPPKELLLMQLLKLLSQIVIKHFCHFRF